MQRMPALFISHGGGPWPYIAAMREQFAKTAQWLEQLPASFPEKPKAILAISGHWEEPSFTLATAAQPPMVYDYSGFPPHTYQVRYPAPGSPELAARVSALMQDAGIPSREDPERGFDHGTFVPLLLMYPKAEIPVVSLSVRADYDPLAHFQLGQALAPLRDEGVLIMGSGLTFHNMRMFGPPGKAISEQFEAWLSAALREPSAERRLEKLLNWASAPLARLAHPREDHLIPLLVTAGAATEQEDVEIFVDKVWDITMASYVFS